MKVFFLQQVKTSKRCPPSLTRSEDEVRRCFLAQVNKFARKKDLHPRYWTNEKTKAAMFESLERQTELLNAGTQTGRRNHVTSLSTQPWKTKTEKFEAEKERQRNVEIEDRFNARKVFLLNACQMYGNSTLFRKIKSAAVRLPPVWPVSNESVRYCPIQKTGSTTWRALLLKVRKKMQLEAKRRSRIPKRKISSLARSLVHKETSFVFVREPYSRLMSAYVDKLFCPNTLFWQGTGKYIVKNFRENPSKSSLRCGHDVTFPEFISYVIHAQETGAHRDGHFIPIHDHCDFCNANYDYIGHLETISEDLPYVLNVIHSPVNYSNDYETETLKGSVAWVMKKMRSDIQDCMPLEEAGRRLWKKLIIRGLIDKYQPFPFIPEKAKNVSQTKFLEEALAAMSRSRRWEERRQQHTEALREAFSFLPLNQRLKLKKILFLDFKMFGFDPEPETVFPRTPFVKEQGFSYFEL